MLEIDRNGSREWYDKKGELHREDGPAIEYSDENKYWYMNGKLHRVDGPAVEESDGNKEYWLKDQEYSEKEYRKKVNRYAKD